MALFKTTLLRHKVRNLINNSIDTTELIENPNKTWEFRVNGKAIGKASDFEEIFTWYAQVVLHFPERIIMYYHKDKVLEERCKDIMSMFYGKNRDTF